MSLMLVQIGNVQNYKLAKNDRDGKSWCRKWVKHNKLAKNNQT